MADCCDGLACRKEFTDDLQNTCTQTDILRSTSAGNEESLIVFCLDSVKICCQRKVMSPKLRIGLLAKKIVNSGRNGFTGFLVRADCITYRDQLSRMNIETELYLLYRISLSSVTTITL